MMSVSWTKEFQAQPLLDRIAGMAKVESDKVSFEGFSIHEWQSVLEENLVFDGEMPATNCAELVWQSLVACAKRHDFSSKGFLRLISDGERQYLAQPLKRFYLQSSLPLEYSEKLTLPGLHGCRFLLSGSPWRKLDLSPIEGNLRYLFGDRKRPRQYTSVRVAVQGRTPEEAAVKAINALDLARALLNFQVNRTKGMRIFSGRVKPVNLIPPGPLFTIHDRSGKLAKEMWWYEPDYVEPTPVVHFSDLIRYRRNEDWYLTKLRSHPYRGEMEKILTRYSRALDETNYDFAIIKLWSVLERLMAIDKYGTVARRAAFLFADAEHHREILNHIRRYRNRSIHGGHSADTRNEAVHQLRRYVQQAILFHLRPARGAKRIEDKVQVLNMPYRISDLKKRRETINLAMRFRSPRHPRKRSTSKKQVQPSRPGVSVVQPVLPTRLDGPTEVGRRNVET